MPVTILGRIGIVVQAKGIFAFAFAAHHPERVIDDARCNIQDLPMSQVTSSSQRRSSRMFHKMRMQAQGRAHNGKKFRETCETLVVNGHGGLLILKHEIDDGAMLVLTHPDTLEEQECRVVFVGETNDRGQRVGVEFLTPAPRFWGLEFDEPSGGGSAV
jgi:hypothetical protein